MGEWHLITGEYPPQHGGVADYSRLVALGLANAGEQVHVWCPAADGEIDPVPGVDVHRSLGRVGIADLRRAGKKLSSFRAPRRLLLQWVPHAYGARAMNIPFAAWLWVRTHLHGDQLYVMVHEAHVAFGESWKSNVIAAANRIMDVLLLSSARRVWVSTPEWGKVLRPFALGRELAFEWQPVPSNVPNVATAAQISAIRAALACEGQPLIGHFGTYGRLIAPLLDELIPELLARHEGLRLLLLGRGASAYRRHLAELHAGIANRLVAPDGLDDVALSAHLAACDLFVQPYPEGLTCRRGSAMAVMGHGRPMVTNSGRTTESVWADRRAVALVSGHDPSGMAREAVKLVRDPAELARMAGAAQRLYAEAFDVSHTVSALLRSGVPAAGSPAPTLATR